ncbi:hypothetical protein, partial [Myroides odoratimimus]|uniref:hypothetical protein n=1 Tax=Myroides odoratimimus TaxID=76832 RepID=UPI003D9C289C
YTFLVCNHNHFGYNFGFTVVGTVHVFGVQSQRLVLAYLQLLCWYCTRFWCAITTLPQRPAFFNKLVL